MGYIDSKATHEYEWARVARRRWRKGQQPLKTRQSLGNAKLPGPGLLYTVDEGWIGSFKPFTKLPNHSPS